MYRSRGTRGNCQRAVTGRAPARIPIILDPSLVRRHRMSVVEQRTRAGRTMVYLVPGRQQRPISSCFNETEPGYHVPARTSLLPDTVMGQQPKPRRGKKEVGPDDVTRHQYSYIHDLGHHTIHGVHLATRVRQDLTCTSMSTSCAATAACCPLIHSAPAVNAGCLSAQEYQVCFLRGHPHVARYLFRLCC